MSTQATPHPFGVQFSEAIDNLRSKLPAASLVWDDLAGPVHAKVFTVAGATSADLVSDMHQAVTQALTEGQTLSSFRKQFDRIIQTHGWTYNGKRGWRSAIIYNTNMRSATMAGRWAQIQAAKADRPYLEYRTAGDAHVRPQHRAWDGLIYPVDDAFWSTHYPPNGWGCRCTVRSYTAGDLAARGLRVAEPFKMQRRDVVDVNGDIKDRVPVGIDPGWDHNVGKSWISPELALGQKLATLPRPLQGAITDKAVSPAFQEVLGGNWKRFQTAIHAGSKSAADAQVLGFLDSATLDGMVASGAALALRSTAIAAFGDLTRTASSWPAPLADALPSLLRSYSAVLWDVVGAELVVVTDATLPGAPANHRAVVGMTPNVQTPYGTALKVSRLAVHPASTFTDAARYRILVGRLR